MELITTPALITMSSPYRIAFTADASSPNLDVRCASQCGYLDFHLALFTGYDDIA